MLRQHTTPLTPAVPIAARCPNGRVPHLVPNDRTTTVRPREAVAQEYRPTIMYHEETGGVQRGQTSEEGSRLPPLALFASFSRLRKKGATKKTSSNTKSQQEKKILCLRVTCRNKGDLFFCGCISCFSNSANSRKTPVYFGLRAGSRGLAPVPQEGPPRPLPSPVRGNRPLTLFLSPAPLILSCKYDTIVITSP